MLIVQKKSSFILLE